MERVTFKAVNEESRKGKKKIMMDKQGGDASTPINIRQGASWTAKFIMQ